MAGKSTPSSRRKKSTGKSEAVKKAEETPLDLSFMSKGAPTRKARRKRGRRRGK